MHTFTVDPAMALSLSNLHGLTEIRDPQGKALGYFSPAVSQRQGLYAQAAAHFDPGEMKRRKESGQQGLTTAEVLKRLESFKA